jgi:hypothetical protein
MNAGNNTSPGTKPGIQEANVDWDMALRNNFHFYQGDSNEKISRHTPQI